MKHLMSALFLALSFASAPVLAFHCPLDMQQIDAELAAGTELDADTLAEVQALRAKGEQEHNAGDHSGAVATLAEAKARLGIE